MFSLLLLESVYKRLIYLNFPFDPIEFCWKGGDKGLDMRSKGMNQVISCEFVSSVMENLGV